MTSTSNDTLSMPGTNIADSVHQPHSSPTVTSNLAPQTNNHANCVNTLVFGSSLTQDLNCDLLSKRGKTFKVFTKGGARVETVIKMVRDCVDNGDICTACVESIFVVAGGNDVENIRSADGLEKLKSSFIKLIDVINTKFPAIRINIMSLIPRRCRDYMHLRNMFSVNNFLSNLCSKKKSNCYLVKMFTKYLLYKHLYYTKEEVYLDDNLYKKDRLHFSPIGTSVLAKTLIAVANNPHY